MHSKKFRTRFVPVIFAGIAGVVYAAPSPLPEPSPNNLPSLAPASATQPELTGVALLAKQRADLEAEHARLERDMIDFQKSTAIKNEELRTQMIDEKRVKAREVSAKIRQIDRDLKAGARKYGKVQRDVTTLAEKRAEIERLRKAYSSQSADEQAKTLEQIRQLNRDIINLSDRIERKQASYAEKVSAAMPDPCKEGERFNSRAKKCVVIPPCAKDEVRDPFTGNCVNKSSVYSSVPQLWEIAACWAPEDKPYSVALSTTFPFGDDTLVGRGGTGKTKSWAQDGSSSSASPHDIALREAFDRQVGEFFKGANGFAGSRIRKIEVVSSASRVGGKSITAQTLADNRAQGLVSAFFATLAVDHGLPKPPKSPDYTGPNPYSDDSTPVVERGPAWKEGDRPSMTAPPSDDQIREAALKMVKGEAPYGNDRTPVVVKGDVEATIKNLKECCAESRYHLLYQPYQYAQMRVYGERFTPEAPACSQAWRQVSNNAGVKPGVGEQPNPGPSTNPNAGNGV